MLDQCMVVKLSLTSGLLFPKLLHTPFPWAANQFRTIPVTPKNDCFLYCTHKLRFSVDPIHRQHNARYDSEEIPG